MWELRWVLLGLGVLVILGVYLWGKDVFQLARVVERLPTLFKRRISAAAQLDTDSDSIAGDDTEHATESAAEIDQRRVTERIITIRLVPKSGELDVGAAVLALREAGLQHGQYGIFHKLDGKQPAEPSFSVANLTEPGSFDLTNLTGINIPGMSFFMVLPGVDDPVARFDLMVQIARALAHELEAELHDEKGSSWSIQRERYVREEIIEYRHQLEWP